MECHLQHYQRPLYHLIKENTHTKARLGELNLPSGKVATPVFMPVGTLGTVKTLSSLEIQNIGYNLILHNTFHLYLRPGMEIIEGFGGAKKLNRWKGGLLTDSGGFQVFSLAKFRKISEEGVEFQSPIAGDKHFFTPEKVIDIQKIIGSDIIMPLDECTAADVDKAYAKKAKDLTTRWAVRTKKHHYKTDNEPYLFGITQGNMYHDLRVESIKELVELDFDGYSIGGLSVGEDKDKMYTITDLSTDYLPNNKARYLMGVGSPEDLVEAVHRGIDMFDCVLPTRNARNAGVFTKYGRMNLLNAKHKLSDEPISEDCNCLACNHYSRGYLRHMFKTKEMLGYRLATIHNLTFLYKLMENIRSAIASDTFTAFRKEFLDNYRVAGARNN